MPRDLNTESAEEVEERREFFREYHNSITAKLGYNGKDGSISKCHYFYWPRDNVSSFKDPGYIYTPPEGMEEIYKEVADEARAELNAVHTTIDELSAKYGADVCKKHLFAGLYINKVKEGMDLRTYVWEIDFRYIRFKDENVFRIYPPKSKDAEIEVDHMGLYEYIDYLIMMIGHKKYDHLESYRTWRIAGILGTIAAITFFFLWLSEL
jgi:hypothetical protein